MNITFLIGNGFDVNLGLKTQYTDFYPTYFESCKQLSDDNCIKRFCQMIKNDYENWSDFELAFGQHAIGTHQEVGEIIADFNDKFADYLREQCDKCDYELSTQSEQEIRGFIFEPYKYLDLGDAQRMKGFFQERQKETHLYNFVSFNYTNTLDKLLALGIKKFLPEATTVGTTTYKNYFTPILHLHGSIEEGYIIIGIDSLDQFKKEGMKENARLGRHCVKKTINVQNGYQEKEEKFVKIIEESNVICVYGVAFGETDCSRWNIVREWLRKEQNHKLIIFKYKAGFESLNRMSKGQLLDAIDDARDEYLRILGFEENLEKMYNQVFVVDSAKALGFKLIENK